MPTYVYKFVDTGETIEVQQSFTDDSLTVCPTCQGKLRKVFSAVGVSFTGSGFYRNDSRSTTSSSDAPASSSSSDSGSSSGGSDKAAAKPAATPAAKPSSSTTPAAS